MVIARYRKLRRLTSLLTARSSFPVPVEISLECARGARFGSHNHAGPTNRGFILTIDRNPQQSDRRFRRYIRCYAVIELGLRQSALTKFVKG